MTTAKSSAPSSGNPSQDVAVVQHDIAAGMPNGTFSAYPTDPTNAIADIIKYLEGKGDYRHLVHGVYDAVGFVLKIFLGDPTDSPIDPVIMNHAFSDLSMALARSDKTASIPPLLLTILTQAMQAFLLWWQNRNRMTTVASAAIPENAQSVA